MQTWHMRVEPMASAARGLPFPAAVAMVKARRPVPINSMIIGDASLRVSESLNLCLMPWRGPVPGSSFEWVKAKMSEASAPPSSGPTM